MEEVKLAPHGSDTVGGDEYDRRVHHDTKENPRVDLVEFNGKLSDAVSRLRSGDSASIAAEQAHLRAMLPKLETEHDRTWAADQIEDLPRRATPAEHSELFAEALEIQANAFHAGGSDQQRIATLNDACRRIWELADQAIGDEQVEIRALTRTLEHIEQRIRNPPWDDPQPTESR